MGTCSYDEARGKLSNNPNVTFEISGAWGKESVGPLTPISVYYGSITQGNILDSLTQSISEKIHKIERNNHIGSSPVWDEINGGTEKDVRIIPLIHFNWKTYQSELPPWREIDEFIIEDAIDGTRLRFVFSGVETKSKRITGNTKSISLAAEDCTKV